MEGHVLAKGRLSAEYLRTDDRGPSGAALLLAGAGVTAAVIGTAALARKARPQAKLKLVARFNHQVTGVAVSETRRIFVNFPRWTEDTEMSVAELVHGRLKPYPSAGWNAWRNARKNELAAGEHFVCVQSVVADHCGSLWILDPAAPATSHLVPGGAKLVQVDLATDRVVRVYAFDEEIAPEGSYLNDVRFSPGRRTAYMTDSGAKGALIVLDLESGRARRVLHGHPSTQPEKDVTVSADGKPMRRADGRGAEFAADGIEVSPDGAYVYWQALTGRTLYRIATEALHDEMLAAEALAGRVERVDEVGVSDGYWMDSEGRLYLSAVEENAVKRRLPSGEIETLVQDSRLRWPDSFAQGPDGAIYVTSSHIMDNKWFNPAAGPATRTELWRIAER
jgi:sugar lactone lactonase YvrE